MNVEDSYDYNPLMMEEAGDDSYSTFFGHLSDSQLLAIQITMRISACLSVLGSCYIIYNLLGPMRKKELNHRVFYRMLLGLSICDACSSFAICFGSSAAPLESLHSNIMPAAKGTWLTCEVQAFAIQLFYYASIFYTAGISINFLLSVKYHWSERRIRKVAEPILHTVAWSIPLLTAILAWVFDMLNPAGFFCYVSTYPIACESFDSVDCIRGSRHWMWRITVQTIPFVICFTTICYCMYQVHSVVTRQERILQRYNSVSFHINAMASSVMNNNRNNDISNSNNNNNSTDDIENDNNNDNEDDDNTIVEINDPYGRSRITFRKAVQYVGIFMVVWIPILIVAFAFEVGAQVPFVLLLLDGIVIPAVGYLNALAYTDMLLPLLQNCWSIFRNANSAMRSSISVVTFIWTFTRTRREQTGSRPQGEQQITTAATLGNEGIRSNTIPLSAKRTSSMIAAEETTVTATTATTPRSIP